ncbi:MAG: hypothetical protein ABI720_12230, partial [Actinomycetes bacterium]
MKDRVFIGLTEVAGYFGALRRGFEQAGHETTFVDESRHRFKYGGARTPFSTLVAAELTARNRQLTAASELERFRWRLVSIFIRPLKLAYRVGLLAWGLARFDIFIFGGEQSFLRGNVDLPLLQLCGKRVIWIFTGSDHRPPYLSGRSIRATTSDSKLAEQTAAVARRVAHIERYALVVGHPASAQLHRRPFVRFLAIGIPAWRPNLPAAIPPDGTFRVVHCPSDPASKGSASIRRAAASASDAGAITYREVVDRPNAEVLEAIAEADLVVDELFSDTPMAVLATEAAVIGRPSLVGGYYARQVHRDSPPDEIPPSFFVL